MPEGPELHLASKLVNRVCNGRLFSGKVVKSEVSLKNPDVEWDVDYYTISAKSRGKEVKLTLKQCLKDEKNVPAEDSTSLRAMDIVFRFGMSGSFLFNKVSEKHKHAHLNFLTAEDSMVLSYVDVRRFGKWEPDGDWAKHRGPCIIFEYKEFRSNVLSNLEKSAFKRPLCEVMLNQQYFNGVGNYLRAEVLYRLGIAPFVEAYSVLKDLDTREDIEDGKILNRDKPDVIDMCTILAREVIELGGTKYTLEVDSAKDYSAFNDWLQCYYQEGMTNLLDHNKRTMWFQGKPGPMVPKETRTKMKKRSKQRGDTDEEASPKKKIKSEVTSEKSEVKSENSTEVKGRRVKQEVKVDGDDTTPLPKRPRRSKVKVEYAEETIEVKPRKRAARKSKEYKVESPMARTKQTSRARKEVEKKNVQKNIDKKTVDLKGSSKSPRAQTVRRSTRRTKAD